jgi:hypothetical protein
MVMIMVGHECKRGMVRGRGSMDGSGGKAHICSKPA